MKTSRRLPGSLFFVIGAVLFVVHILVSIYIAKHYRGDWDMAVWINWLSLLRKYGLFETIRRFGTVNYPPVTVVTLFIYQKFVSVHGHDIFNLHQSFLTKLPILLLDFVTLLLLFIAFYKRPSWRYLLVLFLVLFNPVTLIIGPLWGQWDIALVAPMVASLVLIWDRPAWSGAFYALALLVKQQAIIFIPVLFIVVVHRLAKERAWRPVVRALVGLAWPLAITFVILGMKGALWPMIKHTYLNSVGLFTWVTMHAFNIWYGVIGVNPQTNDQSIWFAGLSYRHVSIFALGIITLAVLWLHFRSRTHDTAIILTSALVISFAFFMVPTEMHERYLLPAVIVACMLVYYSWKWLPVAIGISITTSLNLLAVYQYKGLYNYGTLIGWVNLVLFVWALVLAWQTYRTSMAEAREYRQGFVPQ